jgi:hypothetical protein
MLAAEHHRQEAEADPPNHALNRIRVQLARSGNDHVRRARLAPESVSRSGERVSLSDFLPPPRFTRSG